MVYHPEITQDLAQLCSDFAPFQAASLEEDALPMNGEYRIVFQDAVQQPITYGDFRNEFANQREQLSGKAAHILAEKYSGEGHRIGGYPFFTQDDPLGYLPHLQQHTILLLQLDSDSGDGDADKVLGAIAAWAISLSRPRICSGAISAACCLLGIAAKCRTHKGSLKTPFARFRLPQPYLL